MLKTVFVVGHQKENQKLPKFVYPNATFVALKKCPDHSISECVRAKTKTLSPSHPVVGTRDLWGQVVKELYLPVQIFVRFVVFVVRFLEEQPFFIQIRIERTKVHTLLDVQPLRFQAHEEHTGDENQFHVVGCNL